MLRLVSPTKTRVLVMALAAVLIGGCAGQRAYQEGNALVAQDQVAAGLAKYQEAVTADPGNPQYRSAYLRARDSAARAKIQATIDSLTQQSKDLVDAAKAVGFEQLNLVEP